MYNLYPFGSPLPNRTYQSGEYRYGFQGQEKENDVVEGGFAFKYRIQDSRIGRFLSIDPLSKKYAWNSPYSFAMNRIIDGIELEGLEYLEAGESRVKIINGEVHINIENFHTTTRNAWKQRDMLGKYPNPDKNIGWPTKIEDFDMPGTKSANTVNFGKQKPAGLAKIDPTQITTTNKDGKLHWNYKNVPLSGRSKMTVVGGGAAGGVNALNWGLNQIQIWQAFDDRSLAEEHKGILINKVMEDISVAIKQNRIPPEYLNDRALGDIANVVLYGVNLTTDDKIYEIGIEIVKQVSLNYRPKYDYKSYQQNPDADNTNLYQGIKILSESELKDLKPVDASSPVQQDANTVEGKGVDLPK